MSALADVMRALMPFANDLGLAPESCMAAEAVLRKHAPCEACSGQMCRLLRLHVVRCKCCNICSGVGWTPASVEAAIARAEEQERAQIAAVAVLVAAEREACAQIAEHCSGGDAELSKQDLIAQRIRARK